MSEWVSEWLIDWLKEKSSLLISIYRKAGLFSTWNLSHVEKKATLANNIICLYIVNVINIYSSLLPYVYQAKEQYLRSIFKRGPLPLSTSPSFGWPFCNGNFPFLIFFLGGCKKRFFKISIDIKCRAVVLYVYWPLIHHLHVYQHYSLFTHRWFDYECTILWKVEGVTTTKLYNYRWLDWTLIIY